MPSRRLNDRHIMDDILGLNLHKSQTIQLQSVRLYLQITVLSEISDHSGTHILPAQLIRPNPRYITNQTDNSGSTLQWPTQPSPGPAAWKRWKDIISWLYLVPNTNQLIQPLGPWTTAYTTDYHWAWTVCPRTQTLFNRKNN